MHEAAAAEQAAARRRSHRASALPADLTDLLISQGRSVIGGRVSTEPSFRLVEQVRQLDDVERDPPCLVARQLSIRVALALIVNVSERLSPIVANAEAIRDFVHVPRWRKTARRVGHHVLRGGGGH